MGTQQIMLAEASAAAAATYATWNGADKDASITLSGGSLVATTSGVGTSLVRSTIGKSSGKWYWEYTFTVATPIFLGVSDTTPATNHWPGQDATSYSYYKSGNSYNVATATAYGATFVAGDVISVMLDMDSGLIAFRKNNAAQGTAYTGLTGTMYACVGANVGASAITANFGASAMVYSPPAGYNTGLYS
jgi:hypothetical protein